MIWYLYQLIFFLQCTSLCAQSDLWATIFIHGTLGLEAAFDLNTIMKIVLNDIENSRYSTITRAMRSDPFFYNYQPMQDIGLKEIIQQDVALDGAMLCAQIYDMISNQVNEQQKNIYYTFGWSGILNSTERLNASYDLYASLDELRSTLKKKYHVYPKFRIIGYSHGGNIGLNLSRVNENQGHRNNDFYIDELILLGTPIQMDTDYLIYDSFFKKIYNIYSPQDKVQVLDFLSSHNLFSHRVFKKRNRSDPLPKKLKQLCFRIETNSLYFPYKKVDASPGHSELWSFGWSPMYQQTMILYPFPLVVFIPYITDLVEKNFKHEPHVTLTLAHDMESVILEKRCSTELFTYPWISKSLQETIYKTLPTYCAEKIYKEFYKSHVKRAIKEIFPHRIKHKQTKFCLCFVGIEEIPKI